MAFVMLRNVRNNAILTPSSISRIASRCFSCRFVNTPKPRLFIPFYTTDLKNGTTNSQTICQIRKYTPVICKRNVHAAVASPTEVVVGDSKTTSNHDNANLRVSRFKRKASFLQHLKEKLESGKVLGTNEAFALLKSCGPRMVGETDAARNELVTYVWEQLEKNGVDLQTGLWNTLLSVYVENRHDFEPLEFLKRLWEKSESEPNKTTFSLLIQAYAVKGDPAGAMKIVEFMMANNEVKMTEHIYAWLIQAFAKKGDMEGAEEILKSMKESGIRPRHSTYLRLVNAHAERGDLESVNETIEEMIEQQLYPTSETYLNLLDHLSIGGHHELIPTVWQRIESIDYLKEDIKPLIQKYITRGDYESALQLLLCSTTPISNREENYHRFIERRLFNNIYFCEKDTSEYLVALEFIEKFLKHQPYSRLNSLINFLLVKSEPETAIQVLNKILSAGNPISVKNFHPILRYYGNHKNINGIVNTLKFMENKDIPLDYYCYKNMEPAIGEAGSEENMEFLDKIKGLKNIELPTNVATKLLSNENIDIHHMGHLVDNISSAGLFASLSHVKKALLEDFNAIDASKIIIALHNRGMKDITVLIDEVMNSLVTQRDKKAQEALEFLKILMEDEIPISSYSYTKMLKVLHSSGMSDQFFMFVRLMKEHGIDPDVHQYYQMLKMAATVGNSMAAQFCFDKVLESEAFPDHRHELYEYLISAYARDTENTKVIPAYLQGKKSENAVKVVQLFDEMKQLGYSPNEATITMVIRSHLLNLDVDGAQAVIDEFGEGKEQLRKTVKNSFIRAYVANKDFEAAESLFAEMKEKEQVTSLQYNEMMRMCEATGDTAKVEGLYQEMLDKGFKTNVFTYLHRIRTFIASKQPEPCIDILQESIADGKNALRVDLFMIVLRHLVPTGNVENVQKVIDLIKEHHESKVPPKRLAHALSLVHIKAGNIEEASKLLPSLADNINDEPIDIELNPYRKVAKTASLEGDVSYIENIMEFLKINGLHYQTMDTFYLLALNKAGQLDGIRKLYEERVREDFIPTEKFMSLLDAILGEEEVRKLSKVNIFGTLSKFDFLLDFEQDASESILEKIELLAL